MGSKADDRREAIRVDLAMSTAVLATTSTANLRRLYFAAAGSPAVGSYADQIKVKFPANDVNGKSGHNRNSDHAEDMI